MTDQDELDRQRHWQQLAEQLGVEPPQPAASVRGAEAAPEGSVAMPLPEQPRASPGERIRASETAAREESINQESTRHKEQAVTTAGSHRQRGRERSGKGRRKARAGSEDELAAEETTTERPASRYGTVEDNPTGTRGRRSRGRTQGKGPSSSERQDKSTGAQAWGGEVTQPAGDEHEEVDNLSDWNVPSWTELIDSLYRPDR